MRILLTSFLALSSIAFAQSVPFVPSATTTTPGVVQPDGTTISIANGIISASSSGLPSGLSWSNGIFTVSGSISATALSLTGGPALPTSPSGLYLWQLTNGALIPVPYAPGVTSLNGLTGAVNIVAGPNVTITPAPATSNPVTVSAPPGSGITKYTLSVPSMAAYQQSMFTIAAPTASTSSGCIANPQNVGTPPSSPLTPYLQLLCSGSSGTITVWIANNDGKSHAAFNAIVSIF